MDLTLVIAIMFSISSVLLFVLFLIERKKTKEILTFLKKLEKKRGEDFNKK